MITLTLAKFIGNSLKEIVRITYSNGSVVERIHSPGNPIPEDVLFIKPSRLISNQTQSLTT